MSDPGAPTSPAEGWYADPGTPGQRRYWDGTKWTNHTLPGAPAGVPGYPVGVPGYPVAYQASPGTNGFAIAALVLGIVWIYWLGSVLALVLGYIALSQIKRTGQQGRGLAIAGVVLGWIGVAVFVLVVGLFVIGGTVSTSFEESCSTVSQGGSFVTNCS